MWESICWQRECSSEKETTTVNRQLRWKRRAKMWCGREPGAKICCVTEGSAPSSLFLTCSSSVSLLSASPPSSLSTRVSLLLAPLIPPQSITSTPSSLSPSLSPSLSLPTTFALFLFIASMLVSTSPSAQIYGYSRLVDRNASFDRMRRRPRLSFNSFWPLTLRHVQNAVRLCITIPMQS
ncbi:MAG: hypothetical protein J3Q66DRAFT_140186 [Benniella sp.]|nr:MAG: hypothetical protein J3Q66DRAFT_140186 [Benniella sp.]